MAASGWRPVNVACVESSRAPVFPTVDTIPAAEITDCHSPTRLLFSQRRRPVVVRSAAPRGPHLLSMQLWQGV